MSSSPSNHLLSSTSHVESRNDVFPQYIDKPAAEDCHFVAALKELGAVPFCLTNVPQTMVIEIIIIKKILTMIPYFLIIAVQTMIMTNVPQTMVMTKI